MSTLYNATQNMGFTENGALTYTTTGSAVLDLFSIGGALRSSDEERIRMLVDLAYREDPVKTMAVLLYLRDCRGGQGEKRVFKVAIKRLIEVHNLNKKSLYEAISKYGCYKDVFDIFTPEEIAPVIAPIIEEHKTLSKGTLLEKWMPSVKGARSGYAHKLAKLLGMTDKEYRKYLSSKRATLNLVESKMCKNEWDKIDYPSVPSRANLIYSDAFNRHDEERYSAFLNKVEKGEEKINTSVLYPYEVFNKINTPNAEVLWNNLKDYTKGENGSSIWVIPDEPALPSVEIVTKDGSEIPLNHPWSLCSVIEPEKDYEVAIFTDYFEEPVDPDNIAGIILDDVYYEF